MKFDVITTNPPYQSDRTVHKNNVSALWQKIMIRLPRVIKSRGWLLSIHPVGWRNFKGRYIQTRKMYNNLNVTYIRMLSLAECMQWFNCTLRADIIVAQHDTQYSGTEVCDIKGFKYRIWMHDLVAIPNYYDPFMERMIKDPNKCKFGYSASLYHPKHTDLSDVESEHHCFPCVSNVASTDSPSKVYYAREKCGMFGVPKVIFGSFGAGVLVDKKGEYACTQDCAYIEADEDQLEDLARCLKSERMVDALGAYNFSGKERELFPKLAIQQLAENFWKDPLFQCQKW